MIGLVAEILNEVSKAGAQKLDAHSMEHPVFIGLMYEGLTREVLQQSIPPGLALEVVDGFVIDGQGGRSGQIDGMLVRGAGEPIPHTGSFEWHVKDVLAVFEVKKNLGAAELADGYDQMAGVMNCFNVWYETASFKSDQLAPSFRAFSEITGVSVPRYSEWDTLSSDNRIVLEIVRAEQFAPIRIVFGYGGYKTEGGLRRAFKKYLNNKKGVPGHGPASLPNLIIGEGASLVKLTGHPYKEARGSKGHWPVIASTTLNAQRLILELLWTRLSYDFHLTELFGDDLETEQLSRLIDAKLARSPDGAEVIGWEYKIHEVSAKDLASKSVLTAWAPEEVDPLTARLLDLAFAGTLDLHDEDVLATIEAAGRTVDEVVDAMVRTRLVVRDGAAISVIAVEPFCVEIDGRQYASDDNTGRFSRWIEQATR